MVLSWTVAVVEKSDVGEVNGDRQERERRTPSNQGNLKWKKFVTRIIYDLSDYADVFQWNVGCLMPLTVESLSKMV